MRTYDEYSKEELKNILQNAITAIDEDLICHPYQVGRLMFVLLRKTLEQEGSSSAADYIKPMLMSIARETNEKLDEMEMYSKLDHFLEHGEIPGEETAGINLKILRMPSTEPKKRGRPRKAKASSLPS